MSDSSDDKFELSPVMEDYLKAIAIIKTERSVARVRDIADSLQVKSSSVNAAVTSLSEKGLVIHERYGFVDLTAQGNKLARAFIKRHKIFMNFLIMVLGVEGEVACKDACLMEHSLSNETVEKLTKFIEFVNMCPEQKKPEWIQRFEYYYRTGELMECRKNQN